MSTMLAPARPSVTFRALGAEHEILATDAATLPAARALAEAHLRRLDAAASRFRSDSEVSRLAARPGPGPVWAVVSRLLAEYVDVALEAAHVTGGLVDPTVGAALRAAGYDRTIAEVRARDEVHASRARVPGWRTVVLEPRSRLLSVPAGTLLDLGATAKAHAADRVAARLAERLRGGFVVNLGGDVAVAGPPPADGWRIGVRGADERVAQVLTTHGAALATSSTRLRRWTTTTGPAHHVLDPRTGLPAPTTWAQVTCVGPSARAANVASTAAVVLGERAPAWLRQRGVPARLEGADGSVVLTPGWPEPLAGGSDG